MKILHVHPSLQSGGIEAMICGLVNEMQKDHEVTLCTFMPAKQSDVFESKIDSNVKRIRLNSRRKCNPFLNILKIFKVISAGSYDVVHIHGFFYYFFLSVLLLHRKSKFVYTIHSDANFENTSWDKKMLALKKYCFRKKYMNAVTISPESQRSFNDLYNCDNEMICNGLARPRVISHHPIIEKYRYTDKTKIFVHAGRISTPKNQLVLCQSFDRLIKHGHDIVLIIAGSNQDLQIYDSISKYFSDRIVYVGVLSDVTDVLSCADAMCLPSIWEGLPVVLLESLAVGCIPICSPVGGIKNVVKNKFNGLLSSSSALDDYTKTLEEFLSMTPEEVYAMKNNCIDSFVPYDIKNTAKKYIEYYLK